MGETREQGGRAPAGDPPATDSPLQPAERHLKIALFAGAVFFALEAALYVPEVFTGSPASRPFAINSVAKDVIFSALTAVAAADLRRFARLIGLVILGHLVIILLLGIALLTGNSESTFPPPRWLADLLPFTEIGAGARLAVWIAGAAFATAVLIWLYRRALKVALDLRYLGPVEHATIAAVADASLTRPAVEPRSIATAVDHYWASLDVGYKGRLRFALWIVCLFPLVRLHAPLPLMARERRRDFIERYFLGDDSGSRLPEAVRSGVRACIRFATQMVYLGYYNDPRSYGATRYERFSARPNYPGDPPEYNPLETIRPESVEGDRLEADVVVVGSGAGGAVAARELAARGRQVLVVERGRHVERSEFVEDEAEMYSRLYSDGALQTSRDFGFQVLQGMCVGGSTVVNNGVSFDLPDDVLADWNGPSFDAGLSPADVRASTAAVRALIGVSEQARTPANPVVERIKAAATRSGDGGAATLELKPVDANLEECYGCGYCNIGCRFGKKLSMLDGVLPKTQAWLEERRRDDPGFSGSLEILPRCRATKILHRDGQATGVRCELQQGERSRTIEVTAETVVVAAGAIHSSRLLMDSGIGGELVGTGLTANLGSHVTGDFGDEGAPLRAFTGLQMSHYLRSTGPEDYLIETWFNPVMSQALVMPGWLNDHQSNMERYERMGVLGVLVGGDRNGNRVLPRRNLLNGSEIDFKPSREDLGRLLAGLRTAGGLLLDAGAERVMPVTFRYQEFHSKQELDRLALDELISDASDISVNTGHPQGGNPISRDSTKGVVDERFRVHSFNNVYVTDASVFPTAVRVNPQLTVMALAHRAGSACID